ncbi:MAG: ATP-dependent helicase [Deltaproteobacteria bacterium]|nr:ATP-dependent helicase [Deltaproteobacteria bacterium]
MNSCIADMRYAGKDSFPAASIAADIISLSVNTGRSIEDIVASRYPSFQNVVSDMIKVAVRYGIRKKEMNLMDFDDLLVRWYELLEMEQDILEMYADNFLHVCVDEYQDTNIIQAKILDLLASRNRNIMVVGDDSQSIYSFRGAEITNMMRFPQRYPDAKIFKLEINYRSTPEILDFANRSIMMNTTQFQKELRAVRMGGLRPVFVPVRDAMQQADFVSQHMIELADKGVPLDEMAVLYRAHYQSLELQMELVRRRIPFQLRSGIRFFEQAHVKDVTAFIKVIENPFDETAWLRLFLLCEKIGSRTAGRLWEKLRTEKEPLKAALNPDFIGTARPHARAGLTRVVETLSYLGGDAAGRRPDTVIRSILERYYGGYLERHYEDASSRKDDLIQLAGFSTRFETLTDFLGELALLTTISEEHDTRLNGEVKHAVILSSIHQAKGLEWSVVFLIGCSEGKIPLARALKERGGEDEERRLFYVATTRAKDRLYFCHPLTDYSWKSTTHKMVAPSRFINELTLSSRGKRERILFDRWDVEE